MKEVRCPTNNNVNFALTHTHTRRVTNHTQEQQMEELFLVQYGQYASCQSEPVDLCVSTRSIKREVQVQLSVGSTIVTHTRTPLHGEAIDNPKLCTLAFKRRT